MIVLKEMFGNALRTKYYIISMDLFDVLSPLLVLQTRAGTEASDGA